MITCGESGNIIVKFDDRDFDLSVSEEYDSLVLLLTSPYPEVEFEETVFLVDDSLVGDNKSRALRYSEFFSDFVQRRIEKMHAIKMMTMDQREASIAALIDRLKSKS